MHHKKKCNALLRQTHGGKQWTEVTYKRKSFCIDFNEKPRTFYCFFYRNEIDTVIREITKRIILKSHAKYSRM